MAEKTFQVKNEKGQILGGVTDKTLKAFQKLGYEKIGKVTAEDVLEVETLKAENETLKAENKKLKGDVKKLTEAAQKPTGGLCS